MATNIPAGGCQGVPLPWSKKHKQVTKAASGGLQYSLSNSFAQPLSSSELLELAKNNGDAELVDLYFNHSLEYTPNGGSADLRKEIANLYGPDITPSNVLVFPGAQVVIPTVARALVGGGAGHAISFSPGYQSVVQAAAHVGGSLTTIPLSPANGWQIDLDEVEKAIRPGDTKYIVINEPYNPAGTLMNGETQAKLIALAKKYEIHILCDEVYRLLEHDPSDRIDAMADAYERGLSIVTLSKPWGACGVTIGWVATQDLTLLEAISDCQYFGCACPSRASEIQAMMVLRCSDWILERNIRIIRRNKELLEGFMAKYADLFTWVPPRAGAIAAIRFLGPLASAELGEELATEGIGIKPAYCFADKVVQERDYFRVGFGEDKMPAALEALGLFVERRKDEWQRAMGT